LVEGGDEPGEGSVGLAPHGEIEVVATSVQSSPFRGHVALFLGEAFVCCVQNGGVSADNTKIEIISEIW